MFFFRNGIHPNPYPVRPVDRYIKEVFKEPYHKFFHAAEQEMRQSHLRMLMERFQGTQTRTVPFNHLQRF